MSGGLDSVLNYFWRPHADLADLECSLEMLGVDPQMPVYEFRRLWALGVKEDDDATERMLHFVLSDDDDPGYRHLTDPDWDDKDTA